MEIQAEGVDGTTVYGNGPTEKAALKDARKQLLKIEGRSRLHAWLYHRPQWPVERHRRSESGAEWVHHGEWRDDERRNL